MPKPTERDLAELVDEHVHVVLAALVDRNHGGVLGQQYSPDDLPARALANATAQKMLQILKEMLENVTNS